MKCAGTIQFLHVIIHSCRSRTDHFWPPLSSFHTQNVSVVHLPTSSCTSTSFGHRCLNQHRKHSFILILRFVASVFYPALNILVILHSKSIFYYLVSNLVLQGTPILAKNKKEKKNFISSFHVCSLQPIRSYWTWQIDSQCERRMVQLPFSLRYTP